MFLRYTTLVERHGLGRPDNLRRSNRSPLLRDSGFFHALMLREARTDSVYGGPCGDACKRVPVP